MTPTIALLSLYMQLGCDDPTILPSDACVPEDHTYTCTATDGYPATPSYTIHYWSESGSAETVNSESFQMNDLGNFSLGCVVTYTHQQCTTHSAECHANIDGAVIHGQRHRL